jgi:catechol 2,3-dioxygenase-like lactoylglutathione lyase family enzyme
MEWQRSIPVYPVADVAASIQWYGRVFGFEPRVVNPPGEVSVYAVLYLRQASIGAELVRLQVVALPL